MIRIGSRGSALALWQANHIADRLRENGHQVEIEIIRTTGDRLQAVTFAQVGTKGMFTKEIEEALAEGRIDLAVHSLKDLPTVLDPLFTLAAIPHRADPSDAFVSVQFESFAALRPGSRVGTSSARRQSQLRFHRPDLEYIEFRGNVDTRLRKLEEGQTEAIVLASAGLDRLNLTTHIRQRFDPLILCPAAGQGALAIEARSGDTATAQALAFLEDAETRFAVIAERAALAALGGGCQVPIGIHCTRDAESGWQLHGVVASSTATEHQGLIRVQVSHQHTGFAFTDGPKSAQSHSHSPVPVSERTSSGRSLIVGGDEVFQEATSDAAAEALGQRLARKLLDQGASALLTAGDAPEPITDLG